MAENATFKIKIQGDTASFENSLKGINTGLKALRGEATNLRKAIKLDPSDMGSTKALQKNLQQQLELSTNKAKDLKKQIAALGEINPDNQNKFLGLQKQLDNTVLGAKKLEAELGDVQTALNDGKWDVKGKVDLGDSEQKVNSLKGRFSVLKEVAVGALRQIGATAVSALGNGLKGWISDSMATQKSMIALQNTMKFKGNADEFGMVSKSMQKLAKDTNANTEDTMKLATTFIGLGDNAGKAVGKTEALVKANQAFGGSGENLKGVVQAYGQMSAAGKVSAENIGQLTDNNTALGASLKDTIMQMNPTLAQYGSFNEAVSKGAVSMDMLDKAMGKMAEGSGGGITTINDAWDSFNETMSIALLPTLEALTPVITSLIDKMSGWGEIAGNAISEIVRYVQFLWEAIADTGALDLLSGGFKALGSALGSIVDIIKNVLVSFGILPEKAITADNSIEAIAESVLQLSGHFEAIMIKLSNFVKKISESETAMTLLKGALVVTAGAFAGLKIAKAVTTIINVFKGLKSVISIVTSSVKILYATIMANPFVAIAVAIGAVVAGLIYFFTQTETGKKIWGDFVEFIKTAWQSVLDFFSGLGQWFVDLWNGIVEGSMAIWQGLVDWFTGIITGIQEAWNGMIEFFTGLWTAIANVITTVWNAITSFIGTVVESIMNFFRPLIEFYQSLWNLIFSIINLVLQLVLAAVRAVVMGIQNFFRAMGEVINNVWQAILDFFNPIINAIKNTVQAVTSAIGSFFSSAWDVVSGVWGVVSSWFSSKFDAVKNAVSNVFNAFGNFARSAWDAVTGVFSAVGSWFSDKFDSIKSVVSDVFNAFGGFAQGAWDAITDVFGGLVDWFSNIFGGIKDVVDNVLGGISGALDGISGVINGVSKTVGGMFKGSMVQAIGEVSLNNRAVSGVNKNSISNSDNRTYNTFTINAGNQDVTTLARAVKREIDLGRAGR